MKVLSLVVACGLLLPGRVAAQDLKKDILGKWEAMLKDKMNADFKITIDFKADGKFDIVIRGEPGTGTYRILDEKTIETDTKVKDAQTKIKQEAKITGDTLELKDPEGRVFQFKRVK